MKFSIVSLFCFSVLNIFETELSTLSMNNTSCWIINLFKELNWFNKLRIKVLKYQKMKEGKNIRNIQIWKLKREKKNVLNKDYKERFEVVRKENEKCLL